MIRRTFFVINTVKTCTQEPLFSSYSVNFYMLNPITNDLEAQSILMGGSMTLVQ